jgi:hypothetical protein
MPQPPPPAAAAAAAEEEDMMDEDVFLDESILAEDEAALLMLQRDEALASRLARWKRPALPADLAAGCSRTVGTTRSPFSLPALALLIRVLMDVPRWIGWGLAGCVGTGECVGVWIQYYFGGLRMIYCHLDRVLIFLVVLC